MNYFSHKTFFGNGKESVVCSRAGRWFRILITFSAAISIPMCDTEVIFLMSQVIWYPSHFHSSWKYNILVIYVIRGFHKGAQIPWGTSRVWVRNIVALHVRQPWFVTFISFITFKMPLTVRCTFILYTTNKGKKPTDSVKMNHSFKDIKCDKNYILEWTTVIPPSGTGMVAFELMGDTCILYYLLSGHFKYLSSGHRCSPWQTSLITFCTLPCETQIWPQTLPQY